LRKNKDNTVKVACYLHDGQEGLGLVVPGGIVSLARHVPGAPTAMIELVTRWDSLVAELRPLASSNPDIAENDVRLLAPIARPSKLFGIGLNYAEHIEESGMARPTDQTWFSMPPTAANGPYDPIALPRVSTQLDYEAELVIVVGKRCRYADRETAADAIFGYCVGNDVTIRDWQFKTSQFILGKSFDTHAPHGPWIVTKDEIDPLALDIECRVNGELRQSSNTKHMIFDPVAQVEHLSQVMTLEPGDLLFTGTPDGVGAVRKPPLWLKVGDTVTTTISGIGTIENVVTAD
jgi:2-keto-4-pentenoate hydratase/2-oxohepta-3-ene-1,7-dioic acid hydratase in catechol pathway